MTQHKCCVMQQQTFHTFAQKVSSYKQLQPCADNKHLPQACHRVDVLTFKETNHKMHWSMENIVPSEGECADDEHSKTKEVINYWMLL